MARHVIMNIFIFHINISTFYDFSCVWNLIVFNNGDDVCCAVVPCRRLSSYHVLCPCGSVLGPPLFILYSADLTDIDNQHSVTIDLFVDDTKSAL